MDTETLAQKRLDFFFATIARLNENMTDDGGLFDAGELGFALIEWYRAKWNVRWFFTRSNNE